MKWPRLPKQEVWEKQAWLQLQVGKYINVGQSPSTPLQWWYCRTEMQSYKDTDFQMVLYQLENVCS